MEAFINEVTAAMIPVPELIYFYTHMDYQLMEVGQNKPTTVPEMILQIRLRLSRNVSTEDGEDLVQQIHRRLGIEGPLAEAYTNRMLFTVEVFMNEVTSAMIPAPELIYFYTHMDYQLMEVGQNKPTTVPEMIIQIRLRL